MHSKNVLKPKFRASSDYSYGDFEVDPVHDLCRVNGSFVFEIKDIEDCGFDFRPEEFNEGIFYSKVKGDVYLTGLILSSPRAVFGEQVIKYNAKGKAEKALFSSTITYQNPDEMDEFMARFTALWERHQNKKIEDQIDALVEERVKQALEARDAQNSVINDKHPMADGRRVFFCPPQLRIAENRGIIMQQSRSEYYENGKEYSHRISAKFIFFYL